MSTTTSTPTPGKQLHIAIARNDWPTAKSIIEKYKSIAGSAKNSSGSTPLMMAANGKCGKNNKLLLELLLMDGNGGKKSAAERNKRGKTAADMAEELGKHDMANQLRQYEQIASNAETFQRCPKCKTKLRPRSKLAFVRDQVTKGIETNNLVLELFNDHPLAVERLDDKSLHRVNCCLSFRKELTESMALVSELKRLRQADDNDDSKQPSWKDWHIVDLCSGAQCVTAALCLSILSGVSVTALDIVPSYELPHFEDVDWMTVSKVGNGAVEDDMNTSDDTSPTDEESMLSSFSYMQRDIHDSDLAPQLQSHISKGSTTSYSGKKVIVLAMHCCGALSQRALSLFKELDAAAILVMPCCLPPKHLGYSKKLKTFDPQQAATSWNPTHIKRDDDEVKALKEIFSTNDQDEQYRRWARYLHQCAILDGNDATADNTATLYKNISSTLKEVDAVLSSRNTLITAIRNGSELVNATNNNVSEKKN